MHEVEAGVAAGTGRCFEIEAGYLHQLGEPGDQAALVDAFGRGGGAVDPAAEGEAVERAGYAVTEGGAPMKEVVGELVAAEHDALGTGAVLEGDLIAVEVEGAGAERVRVGRTAVEVVGR